MADIVDVIHKINYEVNDSELQRATIEFANQLNAIVKLQGQLVNLQKELKKTADSQSGEFERISRNIGRITQLLEKEAGKTKTFLQKYGVDIVKGLGLDTKIGNAVASWVRPAQAQLGNLAKSSLAAGSALAGVAAKVNPIGAIVSTAIPIILDLAASFLATKENAEGFAEAVDEAAKRTDKIAKEASDEIAGLLALKAKIEDVNASYADRMEAVRLVKEQNPGWFDQLTKEEILAGKVGDAYERIVKNILNKAKLSVLMGEMEGKIAQIVKLQRSIQDMSKEQRITMTAKNSGVPGFEEFEFPNEVQSILKTPQQVADASRINRLDAPNVPPQQPKVSYRQPSPGLFLSVKSYRGLLRTLKELLGEIEETQNQIEVKAGRSAGGHVEPAVPRTADKPREKEEIPKMELYPYAEEVKAQRVPVPHFSISEEEDKAAKKRAENIEKSKQAYQTLVETAVNAFNAIYDAQIKQLDKEIGLRKDRVEEATRMAEKGNTEQLALEQDRLAKAEAARENAARKQLQMNALLQASNSAVALTEAIGAVVGAAAKGDPYTIALRVAAAVAALVAGIAAVSTAFSKVNSGGAYKDGVVDFKGAGGPRDDANWVRISSGESVITAKGTAANRSILEAINKGAEFKMLNAKMLMPAFAVTGSGSGVSEDSMKLLEKKLDGVIDAVKDSKLKQDIFFNEHGVGLMTQRVIRRDQNRFK